VQIKPPLTTLEKTALALYASPVVVWTVGYLWLMKPQDTIWFAVIINAVWVIQPLIWLFSKRRWFDAAGMISMTMLGLLLMLLMPVAQHANGRDGWFWIVWSVVVLNWVIAIALFVPLSRKPKE
jgi:hypothetical protein